jgi:hypothetical protein
MWDAEGKRGPLHLPPHPDALRLEVVWCAAVFCEAEPVNAPLIAAVLYKTKRVCGVGEFSD